MFRNIINIVPFWWFIFASLAFFGGLSYAAAVISKQYLGHKVDNDYRMISNTLINILSASFSILLAFVIINTWNYRLQARASVAQEADYLSIILRESTVFPSEIKDKFIQSIKNYTIAVRVDEWKKMREGFESAQAWAALEALYKEVQSYQPITPHESIYYTQIVSHINALVAARRERLNQLESVIPKQLRQAIIVGSVLLVLILGAIRGESTFLNNMPVLLFSVVLGFNLALALSFDYPFSGDIIIDNHLLYSGILGQFPDT